MRPAMMCDRQPSARAHDILSKDGSTAFARPPSDTPEEHAIIVCSIVRTVAGTQFIMNLANYYSKTKLLSPLAVRFVGRRINATTVELPRLPPFFKP